MARDYKRAAAGENEDATPYNPADRFKCAAYGCTNPGTVTESVLGSDRWLCSRHFHAKSDIWQEITKEIRNKTFNIKETYKPGEDDF